MQSGAKICCGFAASNFQNFHLWVSQNVRGAVVAERGVCATRHEKKTLGIKEKEAFGKNSNFQS